MIELPYSLIIEATRERDVFHYHSPDLEGVLGTGHSIEDCIYHAKWGMEEQVALLKEQGKLIPPINRRPTILIRNQAESPAHFNT
jgi:predicted RNase H-like HicB family nuclease